MLEVLLRQDGSWTALRDLALLRVGIDSMLRSSDIVKLCVRDVCHAGEVVAEFAVKQRKTSKVVKCDLRASRSFSWSAGSYEKLAASIA